MDTSWPPPRRHGVVDSPLGRLRVVVDAGGALAGVYLPEHDPAPGAGALGPLVDLAAPAADGRPRGADGVRSTGGSGEEAGEGGGAGRGDEALVAAAAAVLAVVADPGAPLAVPLAQVPGTLLQHAVWAEVARIGPGRTRTYAEVAAAVGRPSAHRAVGAAVARNPRCLVVPCHRVVGSGGAVTGYAGGVDLKRWLLAREQRDAPPPLSAG